MVHWPIISRVMQYKPLKSSKRRWTKAQSAKIHTAFDRSPNTLHYLLSPISPKPDQWYKYRKPSDGLNPPTIVSTQRSSDPSSRVMSCHVMSHLSDPIPIPIPCSDQALPSRLPSIMWKGHVEWFDNAPRPTCFTKTHRRYSLVGRDILVICFL